MTLKLFNPSLRSAQVEVVSATLDLSDVRSYRGAMMSRSKQAAQTKHIPRIDLTEFSVWRAEFRITI